MPRDIFFPDCNVRRLCGAKRYFPFIKAVVLIDINKQMRQKIT